MSADELRAAFTRFFVERGHRALPSAGLIPHDPSVMFTIAGMVQFKPYFTGEERPPVPRATTVQPCFRMVDIDLIGTTARHNTFFEMLGNFSFGDYFKEAAIPFAWELLTEVLGLDPDRLWITVHESDLDAAGIWTEVAHVAPERIQKMGDDNFWKMGDVGPCGPSSEIYIDRGDAFGADGGPLAGGEERFVELWNLVFMQYERKADGSLVELPNKNIDTGAGLERLLATLQDVPSVFETDVFAPVIARAASLVGRRPGRDPKDDVALRILADHGRAMTMLVADGVFPSNDGRGYVLRRVIRRAVLQGQRFDVAGLITPDLIDAVIATLSGAYPKLARDRSLIETVVVHEEEAFRRTLRAGSALIEDELARGERTIPGPVAFRLHDTFGFPIDLTAEIAEQRGVSVDRAGFEIEMNRQRERARAAERDVVASDEDAVAHYRALSDANGPTQFVGYELDEITSRVLSLRERSVDEPYQNVDGERVPDRVALYECVLSATPFYAESGGQVGDTGTITAGDGTFRVLDTKVLIDKVVGHIGYFRSGAFDEDTEVVAAIDRSRRDAIRRNHTATHLLHHALRSVLGEHVRQQGSLVAPDRLRFDFGHFAPLRAEELEKVTDLVNAEVITDAVVRTYETSRSDADEVGAIAFFDEKYGDVVRVVEAGDVSVELCGGTHVSGLGMIGLFQIVSEASIGANTRRIFATTGERSLLDLKALHANVDAAAELLRAAPGTLAEAVRRTVERSEELERTLREHKGTELHARADSLATQAVGALVVTREDGLGNDDLRALALALRDREGIDAVGLIGAVDAGRVGLVVATTKSSGIDARAVASEVAALVGGGGGGSPELATAGGRDVARIDDALARLSALLGIP